MFIGHFAVAFAGKLAAPQASLGALTAAALLPDLLWPILVMAGVEQVRVDPGNTAFTPLAFVSYPFSHSLATSILWAAIAASVYWMATRYRRGAMIVALAVLSHWVLDAVSHRPDLPLAPGSAIRVGLGLWNSVPGTLIVEAGMFIVAVWLYLAGTRSRDRIGSIGLWAYVGLLAVLYVASAAGPPPPSGQAVAITDLGGFAFVAWAWWIDRHRKTSVGS